MSRTALLLALVVLCSGLSAQTITVPGDFVTIQLAIDNAAPGDTILVDPGVYAEKLLIDPADFYGTGAFGVANLTIEGTGPGVIISMPAQPRVLDPALVDITAKVLDASLTVTGTTGLTLRNLTFDGNDDMQGGSNRFTGIYAFDAVITVEDCTVQGYQATPPGGAQNGSGIWVEGGATVATCSGLTMTTIQKGFIVAKGDARCDVSNSTFTGRGPTGTIAQNAMQYSSGAWGNFSGNTCDGFWWTGPTWVSAGILVFQPSFGNNTVNITNNIWTDCQYSIYCAGDGVAPLNVLVSGNDLSQVSHPAGNNTPSLGLLFYNGGPGSSAVASNNTFNNFGDAGIAVFDMPDGVSVTGNYFNGNGAEFNYVQAQDESVGGHNWDGNTWSDLTTNSGYPTTYDIFGAAGAQDNMPMGGCPSFSDSSVAVGTSPRGVAVADLDGDSDSDVAVANGGSDDLSILLNNGDGTFAAAVSIALTAADAPNGIVSGNFGGANLAVACTGSGNVRFVDSQTTSVTSSIASGGTNPVALCSADFDNNGTDDVAIANEGDIFAAGGGVTVSLNGGAAALLTAPGSGFLSVVGVSCCDLDGDGDMDLVAIMSGTALAPATPDNVLFYENDGTGAFTYMGSLTTPDVPQGVCCDDIDGDGDMDLVVTQGSFLSGLPGGTTVFTNGGLTAGAWNVAGDFSASTTFLGGNLPEAVACGDFGDDSIPGFYSRRDAIHTNFGSGNLTTHKGWTGTAFGATLSCSTGINPSAVAVGHLNDDNTLDVVVTNISGNNVTVLLAIENALAQNFGMGCPGTGGATPIISAEGLPTYGATTFGVSVSNARPFSPALLGVSLGLLPQDLGTGCTLYLAPQITVFQHITDGSGEATFSFVIPPDVAPFSGLNAYWQWAIFDPQGSHAGFLAFSDALRTKFGN